jgi:ABC-type proline/glycine betaine transport system ATPase subunit
MYSRLGFSVAAHIDPDILLVDEVLSVGDIAFQAKCAQKIRELLKSGATIVLVSHQLSMIQSLCKRVILLQSGQVIQDGQVEDVIPHYENIVLKDRDEALKHKMKIINDRVQVDTRPLVDITEVNFSTNQGESKEGFGTGDTVEIALGYETREKIDNPIFIVSIIRADGVVCCTSRTDDAGVTVGVIEGKGKVKIDLGKMFLAPGVYMLKLSVWDKEMIHTYAVRSKDVIRVEMDASHSQTEAVFLPDFKWDFSDRQGT